MIFTHTIYFVLHMYIDVLSFTFCLTSPGWSVGKASTSGLVDPDSILDWVTFTKFLAWHSVLKDSSVAD